MMSNIVSLLLVMSTGSIACLSLEDLSADIRGIEKGVEKAVNWVNPFRRGVGAGPKPMESCLPSHTGATTTIPVTDYHSLDAGAQNSIPFITKQPVHTGATNTKPSLDSLLDEFHDDWTNHIPVPQSLLDSILSTVTQSQDRKRGLVSNRTNIFLSYNSWFVFTLNNGLLPLHEDYADSLIDAAEGIRDVVNSTLEAYLGSKVVAFRRQALQLANNGSETTDHLLTSLTTLFDRTVDSIVTDVKAVRQGLVDTDTTVRNQIDMSYDLKRRDQLEVLHKRLTKEISVYDGLVDQASGIIARVQQLLVDKAPVV